jgi:hypothetical protein
MFGADVPAGEEHEDAGSELVQGSPRYPKNALIQIRDMEVRVGKNTVHLYQGRQ